MEDFRAVPDFLDRMCRLTMDAQDVARGGSGGEELGLGLRDFLRVLNKDKDLQKRVVDLRAEVEAFASSFPIVL